MKKLIIIIFLVVISINLTGCNSELTEKDIKKQLEENTEKRTFKVDKITYATDSTTIKDIKVKVNDNTITLGDYKTKTKNEKNIQITGYYDQSGAIYNIYKLTKNKDGKTSVWAMKRNSGDSFEKVNWVDKEIKNATALILINCTETVKEIGETPLKYQVYAIVDNKLVLIN